MQIATLIVQPQRSRRLAMPLPDSTLSSVTAGGDGASTQEAKPPKLFP